MAGLYIHIPFCRCRCAYCDFPSGLYHTALADKYLDALAKEFQQRVVDYPEIDEPIHTIYIGGGTPTALPLPQLEKLFSLFDDFNFGSVEEFTIEANPGTLNIDKLMLLRDIGVNRISLGVQSFSERGLKALGRKSSPAAIKMAIGLLQEVNTEFSLDLIFGYPQQTEDDWRADLEQAIKAGANHLSAYSLTTEKTTPLGKKITAGELSLPDEILDRRLFDLTAEILAAHHYERYEISNFARAQKYARHNINYWQGGEYCGLGLAAHSFNKNQIRQMNTADWDLYLQLTTAGGAPVISTERLSPEARARELGVIWLRMREGIDREKFYEKSGIELRELWKKELPRLLDEGWMEWNGNFLRLTENSVPLADAVLVELV